MDVYMIILRLIHITGGVFWVGSDLLMIYFVEPTVVALGPAGGAFMQRLTKHTRYAQAMPIGALLTVVSGILLFGRVSGNFNGDWLLSTSGLLLSIGSIAGIIAFLEGMTLIGPTVNRMEQLRSSMEEQQGPPALEQLEEIQRLQTRLNRAYQYMIVLTLVSIAGMASARYVWS
jgi:uncharacterized membrane protein